MHALRPHLFTVSREHNFRLYRCSHQGCICIPGNKLHLRPIDNIADLSFIEGFQPLLEADIVHVTSFEVDLKRKVESQRTSWTRGWPCPSVQYQRGRDSVGSVATEHNESHVVIPLEVPQSDLSQTNSEAYHKDQDADAEESPNLFEIRGIMIDLRARLHLGDEAKMLRDRRKGGGLWKAKTENIQERTTIRTSRPYRSYAPTKFMKDRHRTYSSGL